MSRQMEIEFSYNEELNCLERSINSDLFTVNTRNEMNLDRVEKNTTAVVTATLPDEAKDLLNRSKHCK